MSEQLNRLMQQKRRLSAEIGQLQTQLSRVNANIIREMFWQYPIGSQVEFWRTSKQLKPSRGRIVGITMTSWPTLRVACETGKSVIGIYVGRTQFNLLPADSEAQQATQEKSTT
jgi:hypothetical protein